MVAAPPGSPPLTVTCAVDQARTACIAEGRYAAEPAPERHGFVLSHQDSWVF
ncbi:MAG TPA: hypothetical protein VK069_04375 [Mycolicibacillus parakoreensis]|nr:hypothetical protein [Mycolicibacillus parakoreensis]